MTEKDKIKSKLIQYRTDPVAFVREVIGLTPDTWQAEALNAIVKHDKVSIRSGHGVGKSTLLSWVCLWHLSTKSGDSCKLPMTAPTAHQLSDVLMSEISQNYRRMPEWYRDQLSLKSDRVEVVGKEQECFAVARTSRRENPEALQGFHSSDGGLLFIIDEASGVDEKVFETAQGSLSTAGAKVIMTGNPTRTQGYFYDSFHGDRDRWYTMKVSCADSKNVDPAFVEDMKQKYTEDSSVYKVRVLGEFDTEQGDTVIPLGLLESAVERQVEPNPKSAVVWGLDCARMGGDRTALCKRKGNVLLEPIKWWAGKDLMQTCGLVVAEYKRLESFPDELPEEICVDSIGIGAGVCDRLAELGLPARGVAVSERPSTDGKTYLRLRDELWFFAREWFDRRDCRIPSACKELVAELSVPTYHFTSNGKIQVESKDSLKKRGVRSPDLADSFCLTFGGSVHSAVWSGNHSFKSELPELEVAIV